MTAAPNVTGCWLDMLARSAYRFSMRRFSSILLLALLTVFSVSNIAHAVSANTMALQMAMVGGGTMAMEDCQNCRTNGEGAADTTLCKLDCTAPGAVTLTVIASFEDMIPVPGHDRPLSMTVPHGLRALPDPFPPRTLI